VITIAVVAALACFLGMLVITLCSAAAIERQERVIRRLRGQLERGGFPLQLAGPAAAHATHEPAPGSPALRGRGGRSVPNPVAQRRPRRGVRVPVQRRARRKGVMDGYQGVEGFFAPATSFDAYAVSEWHGRSWTGEAGRGVGKALRQGWEGRGFH
jgi:hypothetical protein